MNEQANIAVVRQCYDAYLAGDAQKLLSMMAADIDWDMPEVPNVAFSGKRKGRDSVAEFFGQVAASQELRCFEPREFFANGDRVVVLGHYDWIIRESGVPFSSDWTHIFTVKNGAVQAFREMMDTREASECYRKSGPAAVRKATGDILRPLNR